MTWDLDDQEFEAVLAQTPEMQYSYFLGHCADWREVWGLAIDGDDWALVDGEPRRLAVWPHARFAEACRNEQWEHWHDREPEAVEVHEFLDQLIPALASDDLEFAVFPLPDGRYLPVSVENVRADLQSHLDQIEE